MDDGESGWRIGRRLEVEDAPAVFALGNFFFCLDVNHCGGNDFHVASVALAAFHGNDSVTTF